MQELETTTGVPSYGCQAPILLLLCSLSVSPPCFYYMYYACKLVLISLCPKQQTPPFCLPCCDVCFPALKLLSLGTPDASQPEFTTNTWCSLIAAANCYAHTIALQQQCSFFSLFLFRKLLWKVGKSTGVMGEHILVVSNQIFLPSFLPSPGPTASCQNQPLHCHQSPSSSCDRSHEENCEQDDHDHDPF